MPGEDAGGPEGCLVTGRFFLVPDSTGRQEALQAASPVQAGRKPGSSGPGGPDRPCAGRGRALRAGQQAAAGGDRRVGRGRDRGRRPAAGREEADQGGPRPGPDRVERRHAQEAAGATDAGVAADHRGDGLTAGRPGRDAQPGRRRLQFPHAAGARGGVRGNDDEDPLRADGRVRRPGDAPHSEPACGSSGLVVWSVRRRGPRRQAA